MPNGPEQVENIYKRAKSSGGVAGTGTAPYSGPSWNRAANSNPPTYSGLNPMQVVNQGVPSSKGGGRAPGVYNPPTGEIGLEVQPVYENGVPIGWRYISGTWASAVFPMNQLPLAFQSGSALTNAWTKIGGVPVYSPGSVSQGSLYRPPVTYAGATGGERNPDVGGWGGYMRDDGVFVETNSFGSKTNHPGARSTASTHSGKGKFFGETNTKSRRPPKPETSDAAGLALPRYGPPAIWNK